MPFPFVLLLTLGLPQTSGSRPDAVALLNEVSQRYADAKSHHLEAIEERTASNELMHHWDKTLLTAIVMMDGRYRYEGRSGFGSAVLVSDGATQWDYHPHDHLYTEQAASSKDPQSGRAIGPEEIPAYTARHLMMQLAHQAERVKSAAYLPDELISVNGKKFDCFVVHYSDDSREQSDAKFEETIWIDKSRKVVLKTLSRGETHSFTTSGAHVPMCTETTVTYPVVELDQQESDSTFAFVPPADAKLVPEFPSPFGKNSATIEPADMTGKAAPDIQLKSSDGKIAMLSSFRGKPVFLEFWATWCAPCVDQLPGLAKLYVETADKGLVWVSIDSDKDASAPDAFLTRERISWANYHDEDNSLGKAFHRIGIPLGVLIDADGKITFYKIGYGIADLRGAIARLGPQFSGVASSVTNTGHAISK